MTNTHEWRRAAVGAAMLILLGAGSASAQEEHSAARALPGGSLEMIESYAGPTGPRIGDFSGKLVCLRCDLPPGPKHMESCTKEGHRHALSMDGGAMIHPLLAGTQGVLEQINSNELHDKEVTVHGSYYPSTGAILVDRVTPQ